MAKSLVFGNGRMHVGLDEFGLVHDLYYPYVGLENHLPPHGLPHKVGVYVDGHLFWLDSGEWSFKARYHDVTMVGYTVATNDSLGLRVELTDAVDRECGHVCGYPDGLGGRSRAITRSHMKRET